MITTINEFRNTETINERFDVNKYRKPIDISNIDVAKIMPMILDKLNDEFWLKYKFKNTKNRDACIEALTSLDLANSQFIDVIKIIQKHNKNTLSGNKTIDILKWLNINSSDTSKKNKMYTRNEVHAIVNDAIEETQYISTRYPELINNIDNFTLKFMFNR